ncbi:uncharacterized protein VTP21DRAFT_9532 [Calcarisporiella thermophila]|uniref:uncharacterized protein n=1 Tax=Calcarisporiella thermophila TaxID=911321 RepID=UPI003742FAF7
MCLRARRFADSFFPQPTVEKVGAALAPPRSRGPGPAETGSCLTPARARGALGTLACNGRPALAQACGPPPPRWRCGLVREKPSCAGARNRKEGGGRDRPIRGEGASGGPVCQWALRKIPRQIRPDAAAWAEGGEKEEAAARCKANHPPSVLSAGGPLLARARPFSPSPPAFRRPRAFVNGTSNSIWAAIDPPPPHPSSPPPSQLAPGQRLPSLQGMHHRPPAVLVPRGVSACGLPFFSRSFVFSVWRPSFSSFQLKMFTKLPGSTDLPPYKIRIELKH